MRKLHGKIIETVSSLFDIDLIKQRNTWEEKVKQIKKSIDNECNNRDPKNCKQWKIHWDFQFYKALEHQYQRGLQMLDEQINEINCEITYKD